MMGWKDSRTSVTHEHKEQNWLITISLVILAVVALGAALIYTRKIVIPFVVALFIVALVTPIEDFQVRRLRLPRFIAIIVTLLVVFSVIAVLSLFVAQAIQTIAATAGQYSDSFAKMANRLLEPVETSTAQQEPSPDRMPSRTAMRWPRASRATKPRSEKAAAEDTSPGGPLPKPVTRAPVAARGTPPRPTTPRGRDDGTRRGWAKLTQRIDTKQITKD